MGMTRKLMIPATAAVLIVAAACGGSTESDAGAEPTTAAPATTASPASTTAAASDATVFDPSCRQQLEPLAEALSDLDSRLSVGMNFQAYSDRVGDVRVAYDRVEFDALDDACIRGPGVQLEKALNSYTKAYRVWNTCIGDLDCSTDSIDKLLQQHWARATRQIRNAETMLRFG